MPIVTVMMVMPVDIHHNLRLRRIRCSEAEDESQCEQNPFHTPCSHVAPGFTELL
jgi:hypothetical protein